MVAQVASSRPGIQTQVCPMPDSLHIALPHTVEPLHQNQLLDSSHQPESTSLCLRVLVSVGVVMDWRLQWASVASTSNTKKPLLSGHSFHRLHRSAWTGLGHWRWERFSALLLTGEKPLNTCDGLD